MEPQVMLKETGIFQFSSFQRFYIGECLSALFACRLHQSRFSGIKFSIEEKRIKLLPLQQTKGDTSVVNSFLLNSVDRGRKGHGLESRIVKVAFSRESERSHENYYLKKPVIPTEPTRSAGQKGWILHFQAWDRRGLTMQFPAVHLFGYMSGKPELFRNGSTEEAKCVDDKDKFH